MKHQTLLNILEVSDQENESAGKAYCHQPQIKNFYSVPAADQLATDK